MEDDNRKPVIDDSSIDDNNWVVAIPIGFILLILWVIFLFHLGPIGYFTGV